MCRMKESRRRKERKRRQEKEEEKKESSQCFRKNNVVPAVARGPPAAFPGLVHATSACSLTRVTKRSSF